MVFANFPNRNIFIKIDNKTENYIKELKKIFPEKHICIEANSQEKLFKKILAHIYHKETIDQYCFLEIFNTKNEIVFIFANSEKNCLELQSILGTGVIAYSNINTRNRSNYYNNTFCNSSTILRRFELEPNFTFNFLAKYDQLQDPAITVPYLPESYKSNGPIAPNKTIQQSLQSVHLGLNYKNDPDFQKLTKHFDDMLNTFHDIKEKADDYKKAIKACDKKTLDMLHEIEFNFSSMNAAEGYKFAKRLHEVRILRRNVKDKLEICNDFDELINEEYFLKIENIESLLENRKYRNRINANMFDIDKITKKEELNETLLIDDFLS